VQELHGGAMLTYLVQLEPFAGSAGGAEQNGVAQRRGSTDGVERECARLPRQPRDSPRRVGNQRVCGPQVPVVALVCSDEIHPAVDLDEIGWLAAQGAPGVLVVEHVAQHERARGRAVADPGLAPYTSRTSREIDAG